MSLGLATALAAPPTSRATSATWNGTTDAVWSNNTNWSASPAPGVNDTATFNGAGNNNTNIDLTTAGITISNIVFDTSSAAAYTIGVGTIGSETLTLQNNGIVTVNSTVIKPQLVNSSLTLGTNAPASNYFLANNSGQSLTIAGGITGGTGGAAGNKNLFVGGSGSTTITNTLSNGGGTLTLIKVGTGTLTLSGNDTASGSIVVSNGTLNLTGSYQNGASAVNNVGLSVGAPNGTPIGVANVLPGAFINLTTVNNQNIFVGNIPNSVGVLNQNGGSITVSQNLKMGSDTPSTGTNYGFYNMSGGSFTVTGVNRWRVGQAQGGTGSGFLFYLSNTGSVNVNGLTVSLNDNANAGTDPGGNTVLYISGGTLTATAPATGGANNLCMGIGGKGGHATNTVTISGTGSVSLTGGVGLGTSVSTPGAIDAGRVAILNLNSGGFLQTSNIVQGAVQSPIGYLNFNGGTLKALVNNANFLAGLTRATMYSGGLTLDDNGTAVTIGQSLLAPTGTGVVSIAVSGATGYIGAPLVQISGGNPTVPATAVANWDGSGTISTITITDPGDGFTSTPTITLLGGGSTNGTLTATLGAGTSASGGLTKNGAGTLTLSGANTYTGLTTVANGTLRVSGAKLGGSVTVGSGLGLGGSGASTISGSVSMGSGALMNLSNSVAATLIVSNGVTLNNNTLNFSLGGLTATNNTVVAGGSLAVSGLNTVNLSQAGGFGTVGNYRLITGGGLANTNAFILGATPSGPFGFTLAVISGDLFVQVTSSLPPTAFWQGGAGATWNNAADWSPDSTGTNNLSSPPGAPSAVTFATTNAGNFATTLGADFAINTLEFSTASNVTISGANTLTNINGITIDSGAGSVTINANGYALGFNQTWVNNGSNPFIVSSPISGGAGGGNGLTLAGTGTTVLKGVSTYTGGTTVNGGTLQLGIAGALASAGSLTISNATVDISTNNDTVAAVTLVSGTITGTVGVLTGSSYGLQSGAVSAKLGGTAGLSKTTSGTVTLTASNSYTGSTFVHAGTLVVDTGGVISNTAFSDVGQNGTDNGTMTLQGNASFTETADFNIGDQDASMGTLYISNNATVVASRMFLGSAFNAGSAAQGVVNQSGGSVKVTGTGDPVFDIGGSMNLTGNKGSGTYNLSGGTLLVPNAGNAWIGGWNSGVLNVTGGSAVFSNFLSVGRQHPTLIGEVQGGTLNVSGGSVIQANPLAHTVVGEAGTGTLMVASSGLMVVAGNDGLIIGNAATALGTVNLNGGTLITTNVNQNLGGTNGTSIFNFNGGTLKASGTHPAFMTGLTTATVQSAGAMIDDSGFNITIGQSLLDGGGGGGLTKLGTGVLTLTGTNTYSGTTVVTAGKLVAPATQTSIGAVTVADGASLRVTAANTSQWSPTNLTLGVTTGATIEFNALSNSNVPPLMVGTYTLNGTDRLKIIGGNFVTNSSYPLIHYTTLAGAGSNTFSPPGGMTATLTTITNTIYLTVLNFGTQLWTGSVNNANWDIETTPNWTVNNVLSIYGDGGLVQFDDSAATTSVKIVSDVVPAAVIISNITKTYTFSGAAISGFASLTVNGGGLAILSNKNTYSGDTTINSGTVRVGLDNAIPGGPGLGSVVLNATLDLAGHSNTINGLSGSGIVDSTTAGAAVLTVGGGGSSSTFSGVVQNTAGTLALVKVGAGTFTLVSSNKHSGGTTLSAGQLNINNAGALGAAAGTFTINGGSTIDVTTSNDITIANNNPQTWNGDFTYAGSMTNLNLGTGAVTKPVPVQVTVNSSTLTNGVVLTNTLTVAGVISGSGSLNKAGAGTLALLGNNNFGGNLNIVNGTVVVTTIGDSFGPGGVGAGQAVTFGSTAGVGVLRYIGTGVDSNFREIHLNSSGTGAFDVSGTGSLTLNGDFFADGTTIHTLFVQGSGPGTGEVATVISDNVNGNATNATSVTKDGTNVWVLSVANTYTGESYVRNGTLIVSSLANLGVGGTISFGGGNLPGTLLYIGSGDVGTRIINLRAGGSGGGVIDQSGTGLLQFGPVIDINSAGGQAHTLTLQGSTSGLGAIVGTISDNNNTSSVTKAGSGLWTLSGTNTYTGVTTINNGTLAISGGGSISNSPTITVSSGGTLDVSGRTGGGMTFVVGQTLAGGGTVKGNATIANGATLSPGGSAATGTLTVQGNLVLNTSSILAYGLGTNSDQTVVNGQLTLAGTLNVTDAGGFAAGNYTILTYFSLINNTLNVGSLPGGFSGTISNDTINNRIVLVVGAAADPFTSWQTHYFPGGGPNSLGGADPDGDGMSNTNEFLAGFDPTSNAAYLHIISTVKAGNDINVTYLGANGDSTWSPGIASRTNVLEFTTGTVNGSYSSNNFASTGQTNILSGGTGLGAVTNMVDPGGATNTPSRYYRVRVLVP
ncbi:MAG TPA: autotransporter-associated beta strand repeat-containing protein [Verrucomicrobiae bacterium]|nr:autotransporter-associated beta strand repeat-containing protein [Verrucomicrobiae bacterium]